MKRLVAHTRNVTANSESEVTLTGDMECSYRANVIADRDLHPSFKFKFKQSLHARSRLPSLQDLVAAVTH